MVSRRYDKYDMTSTLTAIVFQHYRVATKIALDILGYTMQGSTMMVGEPTTRSIQIGICLAGGGRSYFSRFCTVR